MIYISTYLIKKRPNMAIENIFLSKDFINELSK